MSKKHRHKKIPKYYDSWSSVTQYLYASQDCHKPKFVRVGDNRVFLCGYGDFDDMRNKDIVRSLDLFVGLDSVWNNLYMPHGVSPLVQKLALSLKGGLPNLYVHHIDDSDIDERLGKALCELLKDKVHIGFGCLGGHGRTGWLLGYLLKNIEGLEGEPLIQAIRQRWCSKALEGVTQYRNLGLYDFYFPLTLAFDTDQKDSVLRYYDQKKHDRRSLYEVDGGCAGGWSQESQDSHVRTWEKCPVCKGTIDIHCSMCDGTGYVDVRDGEIKKL